MNLTDLLRQLAQVFTWWIIVAPWEQGLRVRGGRRVKRLDAGLHLRIPFLDVAYVQSVRLRMAHLQIQTVMTRDGKLLTIGAALAFAIADIERLYRTVHHAQDTLMNLAALALATFAATTDAASLTPNSLARGATQLLKLEQYGIVNASVVVTDFCFVRTYRLISDTRWSGSESSLSTVGTNV